MAAGAPSERAKSAVARARLIDRLLPHAVERMFVERNGRLPFSGRQGVAKIANFFWNEFSQLFHRAGQLPQQVPLRFVRTGTAAMDRRDSVAGRLVLLGGG
jgi:hypothetical protein